MIKLIRNLDSGTTCAATGGTDISSDTSFNLMLLTNLATLNKCWNTRHNATQQAMKTLTFAQPSSILNLETAMAKIAAQT